MVNGHIPVLLDQVIEYLEPRKGEKFLDCTLGAGGYTLVLREKVGEKGEVVALDQDEKAIDNFRKRSEEKDSEEKDIDINNIVLINGNFRDLKDLIWGYFGKEVVFNGIVFDLGLSSDQLEDKDRGFSFRDDRPLNMAFDEKESNKTEEIVNTCQKRELANIIREFGEEGFASRIAEKIVEERKKDPIKTTGKLKEIITSSIPSRTNKKIHPATKTFQALRIATNEELTNLREALPQALDLLKGGGRIAVVSYHSLEDRIVKNFFRQEAKDCICPPEAWRCQCGHKAQVRILTKKVVVPTSEEKENNPRSRSAKLRVAEKL